MMLDTSVCIDLLREQAAGSDGPAARRSVVCPDERYARLYGEAKSALKKAGTPVPVMHLLIGVSALQAGEPLLTRDPEHFRRIPGLAVESY